MRGTPRLPRAATGALRWFLAAWAVVAAPSATMAGTADASDDGRRPNVLLVTADDLAADWVGAFGSPIQDLTPRIDALAREGLRFDEARVSIAICQPCRAVWMTGRYPHRSGALGFDPIDAGVHTLVEALHAAGYRTGLFGKERHVVPTRHAAFDVIVRGADLGNGRDPAAYGAATKDFLDGVADAGAPFFLMVNLHDPHRPFAGSDQERRQRKNKGDEAFPPAPRTFSPEDVPVPGFLPDLPEIRLELAEYAASVHRADASVGAVLDALDAAGRADDTVVMFLSDHGMPLPFAKTNAWRASTRTPWIVRWPGVTRAGALDRSHLISGVDLAPTVLEAAGLPPLDGGDGRSFLSLLRDEPNDGWDAAFTAIHRTSARREYPIRAVDTVRHGYLFNAWSDGETAFLNESQSGRTWRAMVDAAEADDAVAARVRHYSFRTREELYDYEHDPDARFDRSGDPAWRETLGAMRLRLLEHLSATGDPLLPAFREHLFGAAGRGTVTIACVGDSITFGSGASDPASGSYPARLGRRLGPGFAVHNLGRSGATLLRAGTPTAFDQLDACAALEPDVVVVLLGTNDTVSGTRRNWERIDAFEPDADALIDRLAAIPSRPRVLLCTPTDMVPERAGVAPERRDALLERRPRVQELCSRLRVIAARRAADRVTLVEVHGTLTGRPDRVTADGGHPNDEGYAALAERIAQAICGAPAGG